MTTVDEGTDFPELNDSEMPEPEPPKGSRTAKKPLPSRVEEASTTAVPVSVDGTSQALIHMTRLRPFLALFIAYADVRFARRQNPQSRVDALIESSPFFYRACQVSDWVFITLVCVAILAFVAGNLWELFIR